MTFEARITVVQNLALENKINTFLTGHFGDDGKLWRKDISDDGKTVIFCIYNERWHRQTTRALNL